jgi:hypothetical protein
MAGQARPAEMQDIAIFTAAVWNVIVVANPGIRNPSSVRNINDGQTCPFLGRQLVCQPDWSVWG